MPPSPPSPPSSPPQLEVIEAQSQLATVALLGLFATVLLLAFICCPLVANGVRLRRRASVFDEAVHAHTINIRDELQAVKVAWMAVTPGPVSPAQDGRSNVDGPRRKRPRGAASDKTHPQRKTYVIREEDCWDVQEV